MTPGTLYIVATPIGNLQDITFRAVETLKLADTIYCEDTRRSRQLLAAYDIDKSLSSLHQHSSDAVIEAVVSEVTKGANIAYLTDAGTPGIADPGGKLVERCQAVGVPIVPIPGPSAVTALLSVAGFPTDSFWFAGYLPTKKGRQTLIKKIAEFPDTVVVFETAPRFLKFLEQLVEYGQTERILTVGRELTKQFEDVRRGLPQELIDHYQSNSPKGELVIALAPLKYK